MGHAASLPHRACRFLQGTFMSKKIPGAVIGRPPKPIPENAAVEIEALAADGCSLVGIAKRLGTTTETLNLWFDREPALKQAFDTGREAERWALHNLLFRQAMEHGNATAAMFLLKARHGYREGADADVGNRISINFTLPGAMSLADFKVIENGTSNSDERISATSPAITGRT